MTDANGVDDADSLRALAELVKSGEWQLVRTGHEGVLLYVRVWDEGSADSLIVQGEADVRAERTNAYGQAVFRASDSVLDMIKTITGLAAPGTPDAPRHVLPPLDSA